MSLTPSTNIENSDKKTGCVAALPAPWFGSFLYPLSYPPTIMAASTTSASSSTAVDEDRTLQDELSLPILLAERVRNSAAEAELFRSECNELAGQVANLSRMLRSTVRFISSTPPQSLYDRPVRRIVEDVTKNIDRALTLVRRCKHTGFLRHLFTMTTQADIKRVSSLLESSISDMKWLLSIFDGDGLNIIIFPIASSEPNLAPVWCSIATLLMGKQLRDRIDAVNFLTSLAKDNERNRKKIVEEGAVPPLLRLLKDGGGTAEGQIAAANALVSLVDDMEKTRTVSSLLGVPLIVQVMRDSSINVQTAVAELVAKMAEVDEKAREEFGRENVLKPLVSCLMVDMVLEDIKPAQRGNPSIHTIVQNTMNHTNFGIRSASSFSSSDGSSRGGQYKRERDNEPPEVKLKLKSSCALALWRLCKGSLMNSRKISEGKGLRCLAKLIEAERGELQLNCLMTVMEITEVAETNSELRKVAWKPSAAPAKATLEQLLRVLKEETDPSFQIPAIKALGSLARTFSAKETRIIVPLVAQLGSMNVNAATEAAIALGKFVCPDNFVRKEHSKAIIECNGVPLIMKMIKNNERSRTHGVILLCYLSLNVENTSALEEARAFETINGAARVIVAQYPDLKELFFRAMQKLKLYQPDIQNNHSYNIV